MDLPGDSVVKNLPANIADPGLIPGQEDPLEEEMTTHSSVLAWRILWREEPGGLQSMGSQKSLTRIVNEHARMHSSYGFWK